MTDVDNGSIGTSAQTPVENESLIESPMDEFAKKWLLMDNIQVCCHEIDC
jgi:hypothetical protein